MKRTKRTKLQCKLLNAAFGLNQYSRNSPLLDALKVASATDIIDNNGMILEQYNVWIKRD